MADPEALFIADHPALDLLNTVMQVDGAPRDLLESDRDVVRWLERAGLLSKGEALPPHRAGDLCKAARRLRDVVRAAVAQWTAGKQVDPTALNEWLSRGRLRVALARAPAGALRVEQYFGKATVEEVMLPLALLAAELMAGGDRELVRKCESSDCSLVFYDRTKSHARRWCTMAVCGNRHKIARFRERQRSAVRSRRRSKS